MITILITSWLLICLVANTKKRTIKRQGKNYLIRFTIIKTKSFSLKIHKALMSDPANLHDHPWNYISLILWGGYYEETKGGRRKWYRPLSLLIRNANNPHRLIIPHNRYCISLILTFKRKREWGFVDSEGKWQHNKELIKSKY